MRHFTLDPQGAQIPVEFDEDQGHIRIAGVRVSIIEVTDDGIRLQARHRFAAPREGGHGPNCVPTFLAAHSSGNSSPVSWSMTLSRQASLKQKR